MNPTVKPGSLVTHLSSRRVLFVGTVDEVSGSASCREMSDKGKPSGTPRTYPVAELKVVQRRPETGHPTRQGWKASSDLRRGT
jgi:hypothetical protein